jgi:hypothetical protein
VETLAADLASAAPQAACTSVYVRRGGNLSPLKPLYAGPYAVLEREEKVFRL